MRHAKLQGNDGVALVLLTGTLAFIVCGGFPPPRQPMPLTLDLGAAAGSLLRLLLAMLASTTLLLGPGLLCRAAMAPRFAGPIGFGLVSFPGFLLLSLWGLGSWSLRYSGFADAVRPCGYALVLVLALCYYKCRGKLVISPAERGVLACFCLVVVVACAKPLYSLGPVGELYYGTVSRTTEVGERSDSRIPFMTVQLAANGLGLHSPQSLRLYAPFFPTSRGHLAGLAATPLVLLSGAMVPSDVPDQPWTPYDAQGFAVYRIFMTCLAAASLLAVYALAAAMSQSVRLALFVASLLSLTPFFVHESYFTWPKLYAATFVLAAFASALRKRYFVGGLLLALGYLTHPMVLLSVPSLLLFVIAIEWKFFSGSTWRDALLYGKAVNWKKIRGLAVPLAAVMVAPLVCAAAWNLLGPGHRQTLFFQYLVESNGRHSTFGEWQASREVSTLNTLMPLFMFAYARNTRSANSAWGPSPKIVEFSFSYWDTLPFGIGIILFFPFAGWLFRIAWRSKEAFWVLVGIPFAVFCAYWGAPEAGLLREGLHAWYLALFVFLAWGFAQIPELGKRAATLVARMGPLRALELMLMLVLPTWLTRWSILTPAFVFTDLAALLAMTGAAFCLARVGRRAALDYLGDPGSAVP